MADKTADLIVLGAGPGGYAAAFRAADLGRRVTLVDPRPALGGVCLNEGCIPSKALLHAAEILQQARAMADWGIRFGEPTIDLDRLRARKDATIGQLTGGLGRLAARRKVARVEGTARFTGPHALSIDGESWDFEQAVVAVGSDPIALPNWPDDPRVWDSAAALELREIPDRLAVVGGGIIGLEMATVYAALGSAVTLVELGPGIAPGADREACALLAAALAQQNVAIHTDTRVERVSAEDDRLTLHCVGDGAPETVQADAVIQAVGRRARGDRIAAERAGLSVCERGEIAVDERCRTDRPHIFAIGDVTGAPMLAHRASHQGKVAAEVACGQPASMERVLIPAVAYTNPELAWTGLTVEAAKAQGVEHGITRFPWTASGRNLASGGAEGLTKLLYDPQSHRLLGATIVGRGAGELLAELGLAIEMGCRLEDVALAVHAHPTLSETIAFSAERALGTLTDL